MATSRRVTRQRTISTPHSDLRPQGYNTRSASRAIQALEMPQGQRFTSEAPTIIDDLPILRKMRGASEPPTPSAGVDVPTAFRLQPLEIPSSSKSPRARKSTTKTPKKVRIREEPVPGEKQEEKQVDDLLQLQTTAPPVQSPSKPRSTFTFKTIPRLIMRSFATLLCSWLVVWILYGLELAVPLFTPGPAQLPLEYMAWSVASNAYNLREIVESIQPLHGIYGTELHSFSIHSLASEVGSQDGRQQLADMLLLYSNLTEQVKEQTDTLTRQSDVLLHTLIRELIRADKLLKKLYPHRQDPTGRRNLDVEEQILQLLDKLYSQHLPRDLLAIDRLLFMADTTMNECCQYAVELSGSAFLRNPDVVDKIKSSGGKGIWRTVTWSADDDAVAQRLLDDAATSFSTIRRLHQDFVRLRRALARYRQDLPNYQSPLSVPSNHRRSSGSFTSFMRQIDEHLPFLRNFLAPERSTAFP